MMHLMSTEVSFAHQPANLLGLFEETAHGRLLCVRVCVHAWAVLRQPTTGSFTNCLKMTTTKMRSISHTTILRGR